MTDWKPQLKNMIIPSSRAMVKVEVYEYEEDIKKSKKISDAELSYFYDVYGLLRVRMFGKDVLVKRKNWYTLFLKPLIKKGDFIDSRRNYYVVKHNNDDN